MLTTYMGNAIATLEVLFRVSCATIIECDVIVASILGKVITGHGIWHTFLSIGNLLKSVYAILNIIPNGHSF